MNDRSPNVEHNSKWIGKAFAPPLLFVTKRAIARVIERRKRATWWQIATDLGVIDNPRSYNRLYPKLDALLDAGKIGLAGGGVYVWIDRSPQTRALQAKIDKAVADYADLVMNGIPGKPEKTPTINEETFKRAWERRSR